MAELGRRAESLHGVRMPLGRIPPELEVGRTALGHTIEDEPHRHERRVQGDLQVA